MEEIEWIKSTWPDGLMMEKFGEGFLGLLTGVMRIAWLKVKDF